MRKKPIQILIADDHSLIRMGLTSLLEDRRDMVVIAQAENGQKAIEITRSLKPDIVIMDILMPALSGLEATRIIKTEFPDIKILVLTVSADDEDLFVAIRNGASGYLLKNVSSYQLCDAILEVYRGEVVIPKKFVGRLVREFSCISANDKKEQETLTDREMEILVRVADGASNQEIADSLCISKYTVKIHMSNILAKLHLNNRVQAAVYAIRKGFAK